jgi:hypothetical protein
MRTTLRSILAGGLCLAVLALAAGCGRGKPPKAIATSDLPAESENVFAKAPAEVKELAGQAHAALAAQDWSGAWIAFQTLSERPDLTPEQRQFVASAIMTIGAEMSQAGEQGDTRAEAVQQMHRLSK